MTRWAQAFLGVTVAFIALGAASCAANGGVDVAALEADLAERLLPDHADLVGAVTCPDPLKPEPGDRIMCDAGIGADTVSVEVTFGAAKGEVQSAVVLDRLVNVNEVAQVLSNRLSGDLELLTGVTCPQAVMALDLDETVVCTATDPRGVARDLSVSIDAAGGLTVELK